MTTAQYTRLPEGIVAMPPGPELAVLLAAVDPCTVDAAEVPLLLAAQSRQRNHQAGRWLITVRECALADVSAPGGRRDVLDEYAAEEPRAVLNLSGRAVWRDLDFADAVVVRLPRVLAAMLSGDLSERRAFAFVELTKHLSPAHTERLLDELLGAAPAWPEAELRDRIAEVAAALDPEWERRRYEKAVVQRRLRARRTEAGTANISGLDLPIDEADDIVRGVADLAAMCQAQGHPGRLDRIHADVYLALLKAELAEVGFDEFIAAVVARGRADAADEARRDGTEPATDPTPADPEAADPEAGDPGSEDDAPGAEDDDATPGVGNEPPVPADGDGGGSGGSGGGARGRRPPGAKRSQFRMRLALTTLMGIDDRPAEMLGVLRGPINPITARGLAELHSRCRWEIAVAGPDDRLTAALLTRMRPPTYPRRPVIEGRPDRGVITLVVSEATLDGLDPAEYPEWARVITDLQAQLADWRRAVHDSALAARAEADAEADEDDAERVAALARVAERRRHIARESLRRFPTAALVRWIQMRDQTCSFPPCRTPAWLCDVDHTLDWAQYGLTTDVNLGPACPHEHGAKHVGGWSVRQTRPGHFTWTSRTGNDYPSGPKPIMPHLPEPDPPPEGEGSSIEPDEYATDTTIWDNHPFPGPKPPRKQRGFAPDDARADPADIARELGRRRGADDPGPRPPPPDYDGPPPF